MSTPSSDSASTRSFGDRVALSWGLVGLMSMMALGNNIAIARWLGPDGRGLYGVAVAIGALALPLASVGLGPAATYHVGQGVPRGRIAALNLGVSAAILPISAMVLGIVWWIEGPIPSTTAGMAVVAAATALPAQVYLELAKGWYLGRKQALIYNGLSALVIATLLALNLTTLRWGTPWVLINLVLAGWIVTAGLLVVTLRGWRELSCPGAALVRRSVAYGVRAALIALADAALLRVDYLIMTPMLGLAVVGLYAVADQITHLMSWAGLVAGRMMLAESSSDVRGDRAFATLGLACRAMMVAMLMASVAAAASLWWLIPAVFGREFEDAYLGVLVLLPAALGKSVHALVSTYLAGRGEQGPVVRAGVVAVVTDVVFATVGALTWGWLGVAAAKSLSYLLQLRLVSTALGRHRPHERMRWIFDRNDGRQLYAWGQGWMTRRRGLAPPEDGS